MIEQSRTTVRRKVGCLEIVDEPSTSQLYQKIVQPSLCAIEVQTHPNRHGVGVHSSVVPHSTSSSYINHIKRQQRLKSEMLRTNQSRSFPDINNSNLLSKADYSNSYQHVHSDINVQRSTTPQSFSSTTKIKQIPLPVVHGAVHKRMVLPRNTRSFTLAGERYLSSAILRPQQRSLSAGQLPRSEQEKRFTKEQMELDRTRSLKRMSETMSHRVDRMYYMRGAVLKPAQRYYVDNEELVRLKEIAKARSSRQSKSGSRFGYQSSTPAPTYSQKNVANEVAEDLKSTKNHPQSASSNKSSNSCKSDDHRGNYSQATDGESCHATISEASINVNQTLVIEQDSKRQSVGFKEKDSCEPSCEPWAEVAQKMENIDNVGRVNSSKKIRIFLTQFEDPLVKRDLLERENEVDDTHLNGSEITSTKLTPEENTIETLKESKQATKAEIDLIDEIENNMLGSMSIKESDNHRSENERDAEGYDINTNDEEIKNMEDGIRKFDIISNQMVNIGHLEGSEVELTKDEEDGIYDSGVFSKPKSEEEIKEALARRDILMKERGERVKQNKEEKRRKAIPKKEKAAILADVYNFISPCQQTVFEKKFQDIDINSNGVLTLNELKKWMKIYVQEEDVKFIMQIFDLNKDKTIDVREFVTIAALNDKITGHVTESPDEPLNLSLKKLSHHITTYKEMFDLMDVNGNGQLSMDELMVIIVASTGLDIEVDQDVVRYIYKTIDKDSSGSIDFIEYLSYIPFFLKLYKHVFGKPISLDEIEDALQTVRQYNL
ncbi:uncharacterized protein [Antedon mediterranea]|uniref:uncharacterized protein isoform X2 n=1 Tax=Antedon mediterranea TaxID=105859 RepID=UPI003AF7D310